MNRIDIIQALIHKNNYQYYLEIGVQGGHCFTAIQCAHKVGVDPDYLSAATVHKTSDDFFTEAIVRGDKFQMIFIDGLHHSDAVHRDIENSLKCLAPGGTILMHDCLPTNKHMQEIPLTSQNEWTGDTWKAFVKTRVDRDDLEMAVIDTDWGCGIIRPGSQQKLTGASSNLSELTYEDFVNNKAHWMNIISVDEFKRRYL